MNYSGSGFEITLTDNTSVFSGKLEQSDEIRINNMITWQTESIPTLTHLKPEEIQIAS